MRGYVIIAAMSSVTFRCSDRDSFLFGLLSNVVTLQWWVTKPLLLQHFPTLDFDDPEVQQWAAEQVVDLVASRFGASKAREDMVAMRGDLITMIVDGMKSPEPPPRKPPHLKLV